MVAVKGPIYTWGVGVKVAEVGEVHGRSQRAPLWLQFIDFHPHTPRSTQVETFRLVT